MTFKESHATAEAIAACLQALWVAEAKLRAADAPLRTAATVAATPATRPVRLVEALKLSMLTFNASPIEVLQWNRKLVTYLHWSGVFYTSP